MDRRRTLKINWDDFDDFDDDDEFFESTNRLSSVVPLDMPLSDDDDDDDQEFDDTRMSFSTNSVKEFQNVRVAAAVSTAEYDIWMAAPGSINDRRRKLLQGMGLNSNKDFVRLTSTTSTKLNKVMTKRLVSRKPEFTPPKENIKPKIIPMVRESPAHIEETKKEERHHPQSKPQTKPQPQPKPEPQPQPQPRAKAQPQPQAQAQAQPKHQAQASSLPVLLVRSRSDGDIDTSSFNTKQRKEEMIGSISKQRLTRTSSALVTPTVGISCQYANIVRVSTPNRAIPKSSVAVATKKNKTHDGNSTPQLDSFFLIKNLDTGKEFIVKEFNDDGMWNKVSDLQTGKQLTMDEFEKTVGHSPVVKELMRRASRGRNGHANSKLSMTNSYFSKSFRTSKKMGAEILKNIKGSMSGSKTAKEKDGGAKTTTTTTNTSPSPAKEPTKGEQKSSTDKNQSSEWVKARAHGKPLKEFSALHLCQEIKVHEGSIWAMKFSFDGHYLATAGEDKDIHIWEVQECDVMPMRTGDDTSSGASPDNKPPLPDSSEKKKKGKNTKKKRGIPDYAKVPETVFGLSEKPVCTFKGHQDDVLALSWSRSELLLSSSMDKTVRLWDIKTKNCLKQFAHSDYVTCIQFNPTDDNYFISGSLDAKVRIWSVPSRKVVDWTDLHDMVTAVCYSPDGLGAIVGLHKGSCRLYSTTDRKLEEKEQTESLSNKKVEPKKITGFQFSPSNPSEVLVTSADSRVRILDGLNVVHKFKGYKNTSSQFSAEYSADGKYIICASEDSHVYIWKHEKPKNAGAAKTKYATTVSYEHFPCTEVTVAVPWPGSSNLQRLEVEIQSKRDSKTPDNSTQNKKSSPLPPSHKKNASESDNSEQPSNTESSVGASDTGDSSSNNVQATAWGLVIVTAGVGGEIRVYQNVGLPVKVGRQTNLFRDLT